LGRFFSITLDDRAWSHSDNYPSEYGYLLGLKLNYKNFLIDFRFQQGVEIFKNNHHVDGVEGNYYDSRQFIIMIGYNIFNYKKPVSYNSK